MKSLRFGLAVGALALVACGNAPTAKKAAADPAVLAGLPALTGRVVDAAGIIPPEREALLTGELAALERRTTDQLVVVTVESLNGQAIEDYGRRLGNAWGVGRRDRNNGVLIVVAPSERKVRIAVGYGLEPILTHKVSKRIIERDMLPHFRAGEMVEGIEAGVGSISNILKSAAQPLRKAA